MKIIYLVVQESGMGDYHVPMAAFTNKETAQKLVDQYNANMEPNTELVELDLDQYGWVVDNGYLPFLVHRRNNKLSIYSNVACNIQGVIWAKDEDEARNMFLEKESKPEADKYFSFSAPPRLWIGGGGASGEIMPRPFTLEEYQKLAIEAMKYLVEASGGEAEAFFENSQWDSRDYYREEIIEHIADVEYLLGEMRKLLYQKPDNKGTVDDERKDK